MFQAMRERPAILPRLLLGLPIVAVLGSVGAWLGGADGAGVAELAVSVAVIYLIVTSIFLFVHRRELR
jgi:amino acid permease